MVSRNVLQSNGKKEKKKPKIKINFEYFWEGFNLKDNLFTTLLKPYYDVEISDSPDFVFFSVYSKENVPSRDISGYGNIIRSISPKFYIKLRKLYSKLFNKQSLPESKYKNAIKIFYSSEHNKPDMSKCDWAFSYAYEEEIKNSRYMRIPEYFWFGAGKNLVKPKNYADKIIKQKRKKFCNFIYTNEVDYRIDFLKKLSKYRKVDAPGRSMNNMPPLEKEGHRNLSAEEWTEHKLAFMKDYKFAVAFENYKISGYTDEKLYHAMISGVIPIYYGNPEVEKDFNSRSFIYVNKFKNFNEAIKFIIKVDNDPELYRKILSEPFYHSNAPNKYVDPERIVRRLKKIFGGYENETNTKSLSTRKNKN